MSRLRFRVLLAIGVTSLLTSVAITETTVATSTTEPEPGAVEILPPDESWSGASLGEWGARWWQRAVGLPAGFDCGDGQHGPVFFLPPAFESSFDCVVAEGTAIYVIVDGRICSSVTPETFGRSEVELQACLDEFHLFLAPLTQVAVNGRPVTDAEAYWARSPMFNLNVPEGTQYDFLPPGVALAMVEHIGFIIAPPPPGEYLITVIDEGQEFAYAVTVTVEAPQIIEPSRTEAPQASEAPDVTEPPSTT